EETGPGTLRLGIPARFGRFCEAWHSLMAVPGVRVLTALLRQSLQGSRSTVLASLASLLALLLLATVVAAAAKVTDWLIVPFASLIVVTVLLYLGAYLYFMLTDPDALRSEHYSLGKLAIEKSVAGDDLTGIIEVETGPGTSLPAPRDSKGPGEQ